MVKGGVEDRMEEYIIELDIDRAYAADCAGPEEAGLGLGTFH